MKMVKNILKCNTLVRLAALFAIIFAVNVCPMRTRMTPEQSRANMQRVKKMVAIEQKQQPTGASEQLQREREKQYQPGKYFVYEQGTSKGVLVDQKLLKDNSRMVQDMLSDVGSDQLNEILLPFPVATIKFVFDVLNNKQYKELSPEQLATLIEVEKYLGTPKEIMSQALQYCSFSLEEWVNYFNQMPTKVIFDKILDIVGNICLVAQYQYDKDVENDNRDKVASEILRDYKGETIPIRSGWNAYYIPNYKVLKNINETSAKSFKDKVRDKFFEFLAYNGQTTPWGTDAKGMSGQKENEQKILAHFKQERMVDFLDAIMKKRQDDYDALSRSTRWLGIRWGK